MAEQSGSSAAKGPETGMLPRTDRPSAVEPSTQELRLDGAAEQSANPAEEATKNAPPPGKEPPTLDATMDGGPSAPASPYRGRSLLGITHGPLSPGAPPLRVFGDYALQAEIARGGMGVVYRAVQLSLNRVVALKMILGGDLASPADILRFQAEAEAAANLEHPHIVPIYEVGQRDGQYYFSMKLIEGKNLAELMSSSDWPAANRERHRWSAQLLIKVAEAVHHAHQHGILHRDLKPANILLSGGRQPPELPELPDPPDLNATSVRASGGLRPPLSDCVPYVTDFGLAKRIEAESSVTQSGAIVGTPSYMPPEQASGRRNVVTTAADVYSLGAIFYEMLTGRPPFKADTPVETVMHVLSEEPVPPRHVNAQIDRDLEIICLKCLEKEPGKRYTSTAAFARDLAHWLDGEPIQARASTRAERFRKWLRRHPVVAAMTALGTLASLLLITGLVVGIVLIAAEQRQTEVALENLRVQQGKTAEEARARERINVALLNEQERIRLALEREQRLSYVQSILLTERELEESHFTGKLEAKLLRCPEAMRSWEWHRLYALAFPERFAFAHPRSSALFWDADGRRLSTVAYSNEPSADLESKVWDTVSGRSERTLLLKMEGTSSQRYWSADNRRVVVTVNQGDAQAAAEAWIAVDLPTGKQTPLKSEAQQSRLGFFSWSPDCKRLLSVHADNSFNLWDPETGERVRVLKHQIPTTLFSTPQGLVRVRCDEQDMEVQHATKPSKERKKHTCHASIQWSPDGTRVLALFGPNPTLAKVWDVGQERESFLLLDLEGYSLDQAKWSPDSKYLALRWNDRLAVESGSWVKLKVLHAATGVEAFRLRQSEAVNDVSSIFAWSADGLYLATAAAYIAGGDEVKIWDVKKALTAAAAGTTPREAAVLKGSGVVRGAAFSPALRPGAGLERYRLATLDVAGTVLRIWDGTGKDVTQIKSARIQWRDDVWSLDGDHVLCASRESTGSKEQLRLWHAVSGEEMLTLKARAGPFEAVVWRADGNALATLENGVARVWDVPLKLERGLVGMWSPDGRRVAATHFVAGGQVAVYDSQTQRTQLYGGHLGAPIGAGAWSADGTKIATASADGSVRIWDAATRREHIVFTASGFLPTNLKWSTDHQRLIAWYSAMDSAARIRVWNTATGKEVLVLAPDWQWFGRPHHVIAVSDNGRYLAAIGHTKVTAQKPAVAKQPGQAWVQIWDTLTGELVRDFGDLKATSIAISGDGKLVAVSSYDQDRAQVRVFDTSTGRERHVLKDDPAGVIFADKLAFSHDGKRLAVQRQFGSLEVFDVVQGARQGIFSKPPSADFVELQWSRDDTRILTAPEKTLTGYPMIWNVREGTTTGMKRPFSAERLVVSPRWSPDGRVLAGAVRETGKPGFGKGAGVYHVALWDEFGSVLGTLPRTHSSRISEIAWSPDGKKLLVTSFDRTARVWDVSKLMAAPDVKNAINLAKALEPFEGHAGDLPATLPAGFKSETFTYSPNWLRTASLQFQVRALAWDPQGKRLATASTWLQPGPRAPTQRQGRVRIWDPATGRTLCVLDGLTTAVAALAWSPDGQKLISVGPAADQPLTSDWQVSIWNAQTGKREKSFPIERPAGLGDEAAPANPPALALNPRSRLLAVESGNTVKLLDLASGAKQALVDGLSGPLAWHPDGKSLAVVRREPDAEEVWIVETNGALKQAIPTRAAVQSLLWTRDGKRLLIGDQDSWITVWDVDSGSELIKLHGSSQHLVWSNDGRQLLSSGPGGPRVWHGAGFEAQKQR